MRKIADSWELEQQGSGAFAHFHPFIKILVFVMVALTTFSSGATEMETELISRKVAQVN